MADFPEGAPRGLLDAGFRGAHWALVSPYPLPPTPRRVATLCAGGTALSSACCWRAPGLPRGRRGGCGPVFVGEVGGGHTCGRLIRGMQRDQEGHQRRGFRRAQILAV